MMANCPSEETSANGGNFAAHDVFATYGKWGPKPDAEGRKVHQDGLAGEVKIRQSASLREISDSIASSMPALASGCYRDIRCVASDLRKAPMLLSLWLPIVLSAVALFVASFLSWVVSPLHKRDWIKIPGEDKLLEALRDGGVGAGNYTFPAAACAKETKSPEYQAKWEQGPRGVMTVFGPFSMGTNLGLTMLYFLACSFCLAYLGTIGLAPGTDKLTVFRFFATAGLLTFLPGIVQHSIWFKCRIAGHVVESIVYGLIVGGIFAGLWPAAT
jgi:hypothetical protein